MEFKSIIVCLRGGLKKFLKNLQRKDYEESWKHRSVNLKHRLYPYPQGAQGRHENKFLMKKPNKRPEKRPDEASGVELWMSLR